MHSLIIWRRRRWVKESEMVMRSVRVLSKVNDLMSFPEPDDNDDDDDGNRVTRSTTRCVTRISKKGCRIIFERSTERNSLTWKTRNSIDCIWHERRDHLVAHSFSLKEHPVLVVFEWDVIHMLFCSTQTLLGSSFLIHFDPRVSRIPWDWISMHPLRISHMRNIKIETPFNFWMKRSSQRMISKE